jgi:uncharacterized membrane protein YGL010W
MALYRAEHRTVGCRISHMIGVPLIVASLVVTPLHWRLGCAMFLIGWMSQLAGHRFFERNKPVLMSDPKNPMTYLAAIVLVSQEWFRVLSGHGLREDSVEVPPPPKLPTGVSAT